MICKFFVFLSFFALSIKGDTIEPKPAEPEIFNEGTRVELQPFEYRYDIANYEIITNTNENLTCPYGKYCPFKNIGGYFFDRGLLTIRDFTLSHAGVWKIIANDGNGRKLIEKEYTLIVQKEISAHGNNPLQVLKGYLAVIELREQIDTNQSTWNVVDPAGKTYGVFSNEAKVRGIHHIGEKAVSVKVDDKSHGLWKFQITAKSYIRYSVNMMIEVHDHTLTSKLGNVYLQRGTQGIIDIAPESGINVCELIDSRNVSLPLSGRRCYHAIDIVTNLQAGQWRAIYSRVGSPEPFEHKFIVHVHDNELLRATVEIDETRGTIFKCRHKIDVHKFGLFCRFIRPDNVVFDVYNAIGRDNYTLFRSSEDNKKEHTCGLIIQKVSSQDYGSWRCEIGTTDGSNVHLGALIEYKNQAENPETRVSTHADDVIVKRGDFFKISCTANVSLDYCYFLTPGKEIMTVTNNPQHVTDSNLLYNGIGLTAGRCGAKIPEAQNIHQGEWKCLMGTRDGYEYQAKFKLNVTDSILMINEERILTKANNTETRLSLRLLPTVTDQGIQFCRWIKPNAISLDETMENRYTMSKTGSQCQLMISDSKDEDIGGWTCVVSLIGKKNEIMRNHVNVTKGLSA